MVLYGFKTVKKGEQALLWRYNGEAELVVGPKRLTLYRSRLEHLRSHHATQDQYLEVRLVNGERKIHPGPITMFQDPCEHTSINVLPAVFVDGSECMVVYRCDDGAQDGAKEQLSDGKCLVESSPHQTVTRRIIQGPARYIPTASEWTHEFKWHGTDPENKAKLNPGTNSFTKLRTIADQFYYNVKEVRTKDDTLITVKLMIFYQLEDIEKMLDRTPDPIADFINAACADVIAYCANKTYETFVEQTFALNELGNYVQLVTRAQSIGYTIGKVVFRGFHASEQMQAMHDGAIRERTKMRLAAETSSQQEELADTQLERQLARAARKQQMEQEQQDHEVAMAEKRFQQNLNQSNAEHEAKLEHQKRCNKAELDKLHAMKGMGIDLTKLLVSQNQQAEKMVKIEGMSQHGTNNNGPVALQMHLDAFGSSH